MSYSVRKGGYDEAPALEQRSGEREKGRFTDCITDADYGNLGDEEQAPVGFADAAAH